MHIEFIWVGATLDDVLAETVGTHDEDYIAKAGFGIERKGHAARGKVRADHLHHPYRKRDFEMVEPVVETIDDCSISEDRGEAASTGLEHIKFATDIDEALVLTGKAGSGQIFRGCRAAHGHRNIAGVLLLEFAVGRGNLLPQRVTSSRLVDDLACFGGAPRKRNDVARVDAVEEMMQLPSGIRFGQGVAIGLGGERKAVGHPDSLGGQDGIEFTQRGVFSADDRYVFEPDFPKPADVRWCRHRSRFAYQRKTRLFLRA